MKKLVRSSPRRLASETCRSNSLRRCRCVDTSRRERVGKSNNNPMKGRGAARRDRERMFENRPSRLQRVPVWPAKGHCLSLASARAHLRDAACLLFRTPRDRPNLSFGHDDNSTGRTWFEACELRWPPKDGERFPGAQRIPSSAPGASERRDPNVVEPGGL